MEEIHGVDVTWLHHVAKPVYNISESLIRSRSDDRTPSARVQPPSVSQDIQDIKSMPVQNQTPASPAQPAVEAPINQSQVSSKQTSRRPGILSRATSDRSKNGAAVDEVKPATKRSGWISSLSSKFSSSSTPTPSPTGPLEVPQNVVQRAPSPTLSNSSPAVQAYKSDDVVEEPITYTPQQSKSSGSFFRGLRRLSAAGLPTTTTTATSASAGPSVRRTMNVDQFRERCQIKELDQSKLRRVAFSVDVEIAGCARLVDDEEVPTKKVGSKDRKLKEKGEGAALRQPGSAEAKKERKAAPDMNDEKPKAGPASDKTDTSDTEWDLGADPYQDLEKANADERLRQKQEKRRRRSEEFGVSPKVPSDKEILESMGSATPHQDGFTSTIESKDISVAPARPQVRPTTDPLRIYRRCCQLREAPVLKRISEQLSNVKNLAVDSPGVVSCLDLTGSRMQLADVICLGDWLAVVPVKKLLLEDANLKDESVRVILAGLLAAKVPLEAKRKRNRSSPTRLREATARRQAGVIEKITFKNNPKITYDGWKHICLFINMSRSLRAIDVSMLPFPADNAEAITSNTQLEFDVANPDMAELFSRAITERVVGGHLEEVLMGECNFTKRQVGIILDALISTKVERLGLANNNLDREGLYHVARYIRSGAKGLDIGGSDLRDEYDEAGNWQFSRIGIIADAIDNTATWALSLANCNLDAASLSPLFPALVRMSDFRFLDLSHNRDLFLSNPTHPGASPPPNALALIRRYMPHLPLLKRIHLMDVSMSPADAIGLAEVLPEGRNLTHVNILENPQLTALAYATEPSAQEEACALYASLMVAARVSKMLICIDVDVPSQNSSEVVKALAQQLVAYTLRNMERFTAADAVNVVDGAAVVPDLSDAERDDVPGDLIQLLWPTQMPDSAAPDHDYIVGGTGVAKALHYVLGQKSTDLRRASLAPNPARPGTPAHIRESEMGKAKAKDMSRSLLESARKLREKLQPALSRESQSGDEMPYRRLIMLNQTLQRIIERFEDNYPDCRIKQPISSNFKSFIELGFEPIESASDAIMRSRSSSSTTPPDGTHTTPSGAVSNDTVTDEPFSPNDNGPGSITPSSRRSSVTNIAQRAIAFEEGNMLRFGQRFRREVLKPTGFEDKLHGTSAADPPEADHLAALRHKLEETESGELRDKVNRYGIDAVVQEYREDRAALEELSRTHPEQFGGLREAQSDRVAMLPGKWTGGASATVE